MPPASASEARDVAIRVARRFRARLVLVCSIGGRGLTEPLARGVLDYAVQAAAAKKVEAVGQLARGDAHDALLQACENTEPTCSWSAIAGSTRQRGSSSAGYRTVSRIRLRAMCSSSTLQVTREATGSDTGERLPARMGHPPRRRPVCARSTWRRCSERRSRSCTSEYPSVGKIKLEETARGGADDLQIDPVVLRRATRPMRSPTSRSATGPIWS